MLFKDVMMLHAQAYREPTKYINYTEKMIVFYGYFSIELRFILQIAIKKAAVFHNKLAVPHPRSKWGVF